MNTKQTGFLSPKPVLWTLGAAVILVSLFGLDQPLTAGISGARTPFLTQFFEWISELRGVVGFLVISAGIFLGGCLSHRERWIRAGKTMLIALVVSALAVAIIKPIVNRPGPMGPSPAQPGESWLASRWGRFPSGHTAAATAAAAGLAAVFPATAPAGYLLSGVVAYERVYRKVHFPSDCFAGGWIGFLTARWVARRFGREGKPSPEG